METDYLREMMLFELKKREPILYVVVTIAFFYDNNEDFIGRKRFLDNGRVILLV